jgi:hypothetical protein
MSSRKLTAVFVSLLSRVWVDGVAVVGCVQLALFSGKYGEEGSLGGGGCDCGVGASFGSGGAVGGSVFG